MGPALGVQHSGLWLLLSTLLGTGERGLPVSNSVAQVLLPQESNLCF